jgi:polysaccharide export outer membrane protein
MSRMAQVIRSASAGALAALLLGCAGGSPPALPAAAVGPEPAATPSAELDRRLRERVPVATAGESAEEVRIGPDDVLQVRVFESEELSGTVRVSGTGEVSLPLLGPVRAAGLTVRQMEAVVADRLRGRYVRDPHVTVQVTEVQSRPVSVLGAVRQPGVFQLRGARSLLEVVALAGGLAPDAGTGVVVRRGGDTAGAEAEEYDLAALLEADGPGTMVRPGDVVSVKRAGMVYVVGEVNKPGAFPVAGGEPLTVVRAIALAGGLRPNASRGRAHLVRNEPGGRRSTQAVELGRLLSGRGTDLRLQDDDVIYVPNNSLRSFTLGAVDVLVRSVTLRAVF